MHSVIKIPAGQEPLTLPEPPLELTLGQSIRWRDEGGSSGRTMPIRSGIFKGYSEDGGIKVSVVERVYNNESPKQEAERLTVELQIRAIKIDIELEANSYRVDDLVSKLSALEGKWKTFGRANIKGGVRRNLLAIRTDQIIDENNERSGGPKLTRIRSLRKVWSECDQELRGNLRRARGAEDPALEEALADLKGPRHLTATILKTNRVPHLDPNGHFWRERGRRKSSGHKTGPKSGPKYTVVNK